jgi:hypothetical protein
LEILAEKAKPLVARLIIKAAMANPIETVRLKKGLPTIQCPETDSSCSVSGHSRGLLNCQQWKADKIISANGNCRRIFRVAMTIHGKGWHHCCSDIIRGLLIARATDGFQAIKAETAHLVKSLKYH